MNLFIATLNDKMILRLSDVDMHLLTNHSLPGVNAGYITQARPGLGGRGRLSPSAMVPPVGLEPTHLAVPHFESHKSVVTSRFYSLIFSVQVDCVRNCVSLRRLMGRRPPGERPLLTQSPTIGTSAFGTELKVRFRPSLCGNALAHTSREFDLRRLFDV
jgi:hypothetical protein